MTPKMKPLKMKPVKAWAILNVNDELVHLNRGPSYIFRSLFLARLHKEKRLNERIARVEIREIVKQTKNKGGVI